MAQGIIIKALSGFYYIHDGRDTVTCRARGKFRHRGETPLVGDRVEFTVLNGEQGVLNEILPRKNEFQRPAVANIDQMVMVVSESNPVTDPFLIDRMIAIAEHKQCEPIVCVNKCDLENAGQLIDLYTRAGFITLPVSAKDGSGLELLRSAMRGKVNAFTGNSGVGKSSLLNALSPQLHLQTGEVSDKLGRGRHTTRHIEFFRLDDQTFIADTPGFSSFDVESMEQMSVAELAESFREFRPFLDECRFQNCAHVKEKGCAVLSAVTDGAIQKSRHDSYVRLVRQIKAIPEWERTKNN